MATIDRALGRLVGTRRAKLIHTASFVEWAERSGFSTTTIARLTVDLAFGPLPHDGSVPDRNRWLVGRQRQRLARHRLPELVRRYEAETHGRLKASATLTPALSRSAS